jgi:hypothetical protein
METSAVYRVEIVKSFEVFCRRKCAEESHSLLFMPFLHIYINRKKIKEIKKSCFFVGDEIGSASKIPNP